MKTKVKRKQAVMLGLIAVFAVLLAITMLMGKPSADGEYTSVVYATALSLLPPVIAIGLALFTKEVYTSLLAGILAGALLYANGNLELMLNTMPVSYTHLATHRVGQEERDWNEFREKILSYYPEAIEREHWEVEDCVSLDGIPYIGPYSDKTPNMYVATGFNGWGMTSAMTAAMLLTDAIINGQKTNGATESYPWGEVFYPERKIVRSQYFANVKENVRENIKSFLRCV